MTSQTGHIKITPELDAALAAYAAPLDFFETHLSRLGSYQLFSLRHESLTLINDIEDMPRNSVRVALMAQLEDIVADIEAEMYFRQERAYLYAAEDGSEVC